MNRIHFGKVLNLIQISTVQLFAAIRVGQDETLGWNLTFYVLIKCKAGSYLCDEDQLLIRTLYTWGTELNGVAMPLLAFILMTKDLFGHFGGFYFFWFFKVTYKSSLNYTLGS